MGRAWPLLIDYQPSRINTICHLFAIGRYKTQPGVYGLSAKGSHVNPGFTGASWWPHGGKDAFVQGFTIHHQNGFIGGVILWYKVILPFKQNCISHRFCSCPFGIETVTAGHQYFTVIDHQVWWQSGDPMYNMPDGASVVRHLFTCKPVRDIKQWVKRFHKSGSLQQFFRLVFFSLDAGIIIDNLFIAGPPDLDPSSIWLPASFWICVLIWPSVVCIEILFVIG